MTDPIFRYELTENVLIVVPTVDLRELEFDRLEEAAAELLQMLENDKAKHLVFDFQLTDYYGSTALGFLVKLWKRVKCRGGQMVFCGVSVHEREILQITHLDGLWPICDSREQAIAEVHRTAAASK